MSWFPRPVGPRAALRDFAAVVRHNRREQWIGGAIAGLATTIIVIIFLVDSQINTAPPPRIVYVEQWGADRTDAEIVAEQKKHQAERDALKAERKRQFQELQNKLGIE